MANQHPSQSKQPDLMAALDESLRDRSRRDRWCRVCKRLTNHTTEEDSRYDPNNPAHQIPGCLREPS